VKGREPEVGAPLTVVVVGASGDLARKKIFPALFALYCQGLLPRDVRIFGFARSAFDADTFRERITGHLTCRYAPGAACADRMREFLAACHYVAGSYDRADSFLDLYQAMRAVEPPSGGVNRMYYLAVPPSVFLGVARALGDAGLVQCGETTPWSRVVIEKPFGHDRASSDRLTNELAHVFTENQTYRIDHYLGKEVVQNLLVLRFANLIFEPIWNRQHVQRVEISWTEDLDLKGRGGYFDGYGIVRDVMQNHLLQILALTAMEPPATMKAGDVRDAKVNVLKAMPPLALEDVVLGQYTGADVAGRHRQGYREEDGVPRDSRTPTFAAALLRVENPRWKGVPFVVTAGKGLASRRTEIRVRFREVVGNRFCGPDGCPAPNELVIRVQPDETILFRVTNKVPGMGMRLAATDLDLRYREAFDQEIPDAYESLLMDVVRGEKSLFIRGDELAAAWDIFTPVLHAVDARGIVPAPYPFGSEGPAQARALCERAAARDAGSDVKPEGRTT
jgi:glucose-6-phosphate 1-dehydrogenase